MKSILFLIVLIFLIEGASQKEKLIKRGIRKRGKVPSDLIDILSKYIAKKPIYRI